MPLRPAGKWPGQWQEYEPSLRVVQQRREERRRQRIQIGLGFPRMMWRATNSGVSSCMWMKPCNSRNMSLRDVPRSARLAVQIDRDMRILEAYLLNEGSANSSALRSVFLALQLRIPHHRSTAEMPKRRSAAERNEVRSPLTGNTEDFHPFLFNRISKARMPNPLAFSERKSSSMMMIGNLNFII